MNWPQFTKQIILARGTINETEANLIKKAVLEDGSVDREELEWLVALKREAKEVHPVFDRFVLAVLKKLVLGDGLIEDREALWLRQIIFADKTISPDEAAFLKDLKQKATAYGKEFERLLKDCSRLGHPELA
jgi:uncharacterized tellurite resistance protein B-like protein